VTSTPIPAPTEPLVDEKGGITLPWYNYISRAANTTTVTSNSEFVFVTDYGAVADGVTNDAVAIQDALNSGAGLVLLPPASVCNVGSGLTVASFQTLQGLGNSTIRTTAATGDVITLGDTSTLRNFGITSSATRTAGAFIKGTLQATIQNVNMTAYFEGINLAGASSGALGQPRIENVIGQTPATGSGSYGIRLHNFSSAYLSNILLAGAGGVSTQPDKGLILVDGDTCMAQQIHAVGHGIGLSVEPTVFVGALNFSNSLFDSTNVANTPTAKIHAPTGVGITIVRFSNTSFGNATGATSDGMLMTTAGTGTISGVDFSNCIFVNNTGHGMTADSSGITRVHLMGGGAAGNSLSGLNFGSNLTGLNVHGMSLGSGYGFGGNGAYGLVLADTLDYATIIGNVFIGNSSGTINTLSAGANIVAANNV
jgi:hypothetical protein